ncbi:BON domain-containing protein [Pseudomonas nunensis]|uniref:BON domain-containing protein n=1 Tax=Pseudomonas nunensis TaxID=2961896 RepID=A0ABY5EM46_9PSED|nr:BON domain-containing protein [Pseudomonas nunensis]KPN90567.1 OsmY domain-containing protein [Pseudomonas nunensis]MCL5225422.1 BON domain-containing protein [Pseudomonas nunensis]UTO16818.1 BON domain-containing protein [Pseudomonas nunensis]
MKTDQELKNDILAELRWEPSVNAEQIGVEVKDGIVTLAGHVNSYVEKWAAEQAVQKISGVRALAVEMDVKLPGLSQRNDADVARSADSALEWATNLPKDSIKIQVEGGWVSLTGDVEWEYQRREAEGAVRNLMGVKGINNNISIKSAVSVRGVKVEITEALKRRAIIDSQKITVEVHGADVTLSGTVDNWAERELAMHSAWSAAGVKNVQNNIIVSY